MRARARELFRRNVREGSFVEEWSSEQAEGSKRLKALLDKALRHPMSKAEDNVIAQVQNACS
jgi:ketol-acid reductoisomerase